MHGMMSSDPVLHLLDGRDVHRTRRIPVVGRPNLVLVLEQPLHEVVELSAVGEELLGALGGGELVALHVPELGAAAVVGPQREVLRQVRVGARRPEQPRDVEHLGRRAQRVGGFPLQALPHPAQPPVLVEVQPRARRRRLHEPRPRLQLRQRHMVDWWWLLAASRRTESTDGGGGRAISSGSRWISLVASSLVRCLILLVLLCTRLFAPSCFVFFDGCLARYRGQVTPWDVMSDELLLYTSVMVMQEAQVGGYELVKGD